MNSNYRKFLEQIDAALLDAEYSHGTLDASPERKALFLKGAAEILQNALFFDYVLARDEAITDTIEKIQTDGDYWYYNNKRVADVSDYRLAVLFTIFQRLYVGNKLPIDLM